MTSEHNDHDNDNDHNEHEMPDISFSAFLNDMSDDQYEEKVTQIETLSDEFTTIIAQVGIVHFSEVLLGALMRHFEPNAIIFGTRFNDDYIEDHADELNEKNGLFGIYGDTAGGYEIASQLLWDHPWMVEIWLDEYEEYQQQLTQDEDDEQHPLDQFDDHIAGEA